MENSSFALTTLSENPEYYDQVIALIEEEFHYSSEQHFEKDFALLLDPLNFENCYLYVDRESGEVVSHLAVCPRSMIKNHCPLEVAFIGGIATAKTHRGKDLFTNLMNHALKEHSPRSALFLLWSEITGLYEKFSFHLSGGLIETGPSPFTFNDRPPGFEKTTFKELSLEDFESVRNLYETFNQRYFFTVLRGEKEWAIIREMTSVDLYVKRDSQQDIVEYFCVNKGRDLSNIIHEISCHPDHYISLVSSLQKFRVWLPESEHELSLHKEIFFTSFMRMGDVEKLNHFLRGVTKGELTISSMENDALTFLFKNISHTCSSKDFLQYLFGPKPLKEFEHLVLSPYIPGTDSV